jgi:saccharopine dehydrogenase-like NADP-dependent oxidoreductase
VPRAVLVVGGAGAFGSRLVDGLVRTCDFAVVIAGRDPARAEMRATALGSRARAMRLDTAAVTAEDLRASGAFAVVDAAGPFQGAQYRLARAAIAAGMHYVDLADARDFVIDLILDSRRALRRAAVGLDCRTTHGGNNYDRHACPLAARRSSRRPARPDQGTAHPAQ